MKISQQIKFIVLNKHANYLYSQTVDRWCRATTLAGSDTWKVLDGSEVSLQSFCKIGFNAVGSDPTNSKARIGWTGNNENECSSCDSRIGFVSGGRQADVNSRGNEASLFPDNGNKHLMCHGMLLD